jgi:hypothetical protein
MTLIAVYIGAGTHIKPINTKIDGKHIQIMLCFDSLPNTQFPILGHINSDNSKIQFLRELRSNARDLGFVETKPLVFTNTKGQEIRYFTNTPFPSGINDKLRLEISKADTLVVAGFHPHKHVLSMMNPPINIICMNNTYYGLDDTEEDSVVRKLYQDTSDIYISKILYYYTDNDFKEFESIAALEEFNKQIT